MKSLKSGQMLTIKNPFPPRGILWKLRYGITLIKIIDKPVFYRTWANKGVLRIKHFFNEDLAFLNFEEFTKKYLLQTNFLEYYGIVRKINRAQKKTKVIQKNQKLKEDNTINKLCSVVKPSRLVYQILIQKQCTPPMKSQEKWILDCRLMFVKDLDWTFVYNLPRLCTTSIKLRNFQFKFLQRQIATNSFLYKINVAESE